MPIAKYGVLKGTIVDRRFGGGSKPHYQIKVVDQSNEYRLAVNVESDQPPHEVAFFVADPFEHPITEGLKELAVGFHLLESRPDSLALDYIRRNLIPDFRDMIPLPATASGPDNDLNEKLDGYVQRAMADEDALIYAFGQRWGPEANKMDKYFGFKPGNGVHDIHMNQGNRPATKPGQKDHTEDNGVYQDGGLLFNFPSRDQWVAIFMRFQSQDIHTDDKTGFPRADSEGGAPSDHEDIPPAPQPNDQPTGENPDGWVRIVGALVNDVQSPEEESVTLLNTGNESMDLTGWMIADKLKNKFTLDGSIAAGATRAIHVKAPVTLSNKGGIITLLRSDGTKVHGVSYTKSQARNPGWTIPF